MICALRKININIPNPRRDVAFATSRYLSTHGMRVAHRCTCGTCSGGPASSTRGEEIGPAAEKSATRVERSPACCMHCVGILFESGSLLCMICTLRKIGINIPNSRKERKTLRLPLPRTCRLTKCKWHIDVPVALAAGDRRHPHAACQRLLEIPLS